MFAFKPNFIPAQLIQALNQRDNDGFLYSVDTLNKAKDKALEIQAEPFGVLLALLFDAKLSNVPDWRGQPIPLGQNDEANFSLGARHVGEIGEWAGFGIPALVDATLAARHTAVAAKM